MYMDVFLRWWLAYLSQYYHACQLSTLPVDSSPGSRAMQYRRWTCKMCINLSWHYYLQIWQLVAFPRYIANDCSWDPYDHLTQDLQSSLLRWSQSQNLVPVDDDGDLEPRQKENLVSRELSDKEELAEPDRVCTRSLKSWIQHFEMEIQTAPRNKTRLKYVSKIIDWGRWTWAN